MKYISKHSQFSKIYNFISSFNFLQGGNVIKSFVIVIRCIINKINLIKHSYISLFMKYETKKDKANT